MPSRRLLLRTAMLAVLAALALPTVAAADPPTGQGQGPQQQPPGQPGPGKPGNGEGNGHDKDRGNGHDKARGHGHDDDGGGGATGDRAFCAPEALDPSDCVIGSSAGGLLTFDFMGSSGPLGEDPTGTFVVDQPGSGSYTQRITCFQVVGNRAYIAGETIEATGVFAANVGTFQTLTVADNGSGGTDRVSVIFFYATDPGALPNCGALEPQFPVDGDIVDEDGV
jgi:hypothetical protein